VTAGPRARRAAPPPDDAPAASAPLTRGRIVAEILIVLGLSLGASAVYSVVAIANRLTQDTPISQQSATLNASRSDREVFDLIYQLLSVAFDLVPVALVVYLLWRTTRPHLARLGVDGERVLPDIGLGALLVLVIGIPGIGVYLGGRALGLTPNVIPSALDDHWWTVPVLVLSALRAGLTEEVIVVGYLFERLRRLGWGTWPIIVAAALLRGSYHLYQGVPAFIGNVAMGLVFGWLYARFGRLLPLIVAHTLIDTAVFVGYPLAVAWFPTLFGPG